MLNVWQGLFFVKRGSQMLKIDRNSITITRGDSVRFEIALKNRDIKDGTMAVFTVKDTPWEPCRPAIEKVIEVLDGVVHVILEPWETDLQAGNYVWDVRIKEPNEDGQYEVITPIEYASFRVVEAIGE